MQASPPNNFLRFLRWFCKEEYLEEFEGDFVELYEEMYSESPSLANRKFRWTVLRCFRTPFIKTPKIFRSLISPTMTLNNFKIGWRSLRKRPFFTMLNTLGLAIGLGGCFYIALFIQDELSFDRMFKDADRIYRLNIDNRTAGELTKYASSPGPLAQVIASDFPAAELVTRFRGIYSVLLRPLDLQTTVKEENVVGVDASFLKMFGISLTQGDPMTALREPNSLVLSQSAAHKFFGDQPAYGQTMVLDNDDIYQVTGIVADMPQNSFLRDYSIFISMASFEDAESPAWNNWNFPTFVKLRPGATVDHFQGFLDSVKERYLIPWAMTFIPGLTIESSREADAASGNYMKFGQIPLTDIHLYSGDREEEFNPTGNIQNIYILAAIGFFLLLLAIVNFMNLSIAQALQRGKEVAIRKTLGSRSSSLIWQFLTEAGILSLVALMFASAITFVCLPLLNKISGKNLILPFHQPAFWGLMIIGAGVLSFLCGLYPALFLSKFQPVKVLSGLDRLPRDGSKVRNYLLLMQFGVSALLVVATSVIYLQVHFMRSKDLGYQKEQILVINDADAAGEKLEALKQKILSLDQVAQVSLSSYLPTPSARNGITLFRDGKVLEPESALIIGSWGIDYDYLPTLNLELIAGRNFQRNFGQDSNSLLLNETAVSMMGMEPDEAIGIKLTSDFRREDKENSRFKTVIGVVKNFHFENMRNRINGLSLSLGGSPDKMMVRLNSTAYEKVIEEIKSFWLMLAPGQPFAHYFLDDSFEKTYAADKRLSRIFLLFTLLSLFVACLGLFGISAYHVERKTKEISIRKILGASITQVSGLLFNQFLRIILLANLIALPIGWYAAQKWLQNFSFRINIPFWIFGLTVFMLLIIAIITVSFQGVRAYLTNPINSLRQD